MTKFNFDSSKFYSIAAIAKRIKETAQSKLIITGWANKELKENEDLARRRAESLKKIFISDFGLSENLISIQSGAISDSKANDGDARKVSISSNLSKIFDNIKLKDTIYTPSESLLNATIDFRPRAEIALWNLELFINDSTSNLTANGESLPASFTFNLKTLGEQLKDADSLVVKARFKDKSGAMSYSKKKIDALKRSSKRRFDIILPNGKTLMRFNWYIDPQNSDRTIPNALRDLKKFSVETGATPTTIELISYSYDSFCIKELLKSIKKDFPDVLIKTQTAHTDKSTPDQDYRINCNIEGK